MLRTAAVLRTVALIAFATSKNDLACTCNVQVAVGFRGEKAHVFTYRVRISNLRQEPVKVLGRSWTIKVGEGPGGQGGCAVRFCNNLTPDHGHRKSS